MYQPTNPIFKKSLNKNASEKAQNVYILYKAISLAFSLYLAIIYALSYFLLLKLSVTLDIILFSVFVVLSILFYILEYRLKKNNVLVTLLYITFEGLLLSSMSVLFESLTNNSMSMISSKLLMVITIAMVLSSLVSITVYFLREKIRNFKILFLIKMLVSLLLSISVVVIIKEEDVIYLIQDLLSMLIIFLIFNFMSFVYEEYSRTIILSRNEEINKYNLAVSNITLIKYIVVELINYMKKI